MLLCWFMFIYKHEILLQQNLSIILFTTLVAIHSVHYFPGLFWDYFISRLNWSRDPHYNWQGIYMFYYEIALILEQWSSYYNTLILWITLSFSRHSIQKYFSMPLKYSTDIMNPDNHRFSKPPPIVNGSSQNILNVGSCSSSCKLDPKSLLQAWPAQIIQLRYCLMGFQDKQYNEHDDGWFDSCQRLFTL